jgi:hypothetical protein
MDALVEKLDAKLREWKPETAAQVRARVAEIISVADQGALDLLRSRALEQVGLDMLDEPAARERLAGPQLGPQTAL